MIAEETRLKLKELKQLLSSYGKVAVAYSSGVDSTFLLAVAREVLGDDVIALTAKSSSFPSRELVEAVDFCEGLGVKHIVLESDELQVEGFSQNPPNRCYICKKALFQNFLKKADEEGMHCVVEGSNVDDEGDYRPGLQAIAELDIKSPLRACRLTKAEIRALSEEMHLPTFNKPSFACLASRFPYGEPITADKLHMVEQGEELLLSLGFTQFRVRMHGMMARIELLPEELPRMLEQELREEVAKQLKSYGFTYVALDLQGYRMGSMNETL